MYIEVCFYKQYDLELVGLREKGYPIGDMLKKSLIAYANGAPLKFLIDECELVNLSDSKSFRTRMNITDEKTIALLKNIKHRMRNTFCKAVLRDSLVTQSLSSFFRNSSFCELEKNKISNINIDSIPNIYVLDKAKITQGKLKLKNDILIRTVSGKTDSIQFKTPPNELEELKAIVNTLVQQNQALMSAKSLNETKPDLEVPKVEEKNEIPKIVNGDDNSNASVIDNALNTKNVESLELDKNTTNEFNPTNMDLDDDLMALFDGIMD